MDEYATLVPLKWYQMTIRQKGISMKRDFIPVTIVILMLMSTMGCSVVRLAENRAGYGVARTPAGAPEIRRTHLSRQDLQLGISATDSGLSLQFRFLPYYHLEQRQTFTAKPRITGVDIAVGIASAGFLGWVAYDNWSGTGTYVVAGDGSFREGRSFDWGGAALWQKAVMIGVPTDFALAGVLHAIPWKTTPPWEQSGEEKGMPQWLKQHPYRLELPGYNLRKDYKTTSGDETIAIRGFLEGLQNPAPFLEADTLQIRAFTEFEGKPYQQTLTLTEAVRLEPFRAFARATASEKDTEALKTPPVTSRPKIALDTLPTVTANTQRVAIRGSVKSNIGIQGDRILISSDGSPLPSATLTANGKFTTSLLLDEGDNRITITVHDKNKQRAQQVVTLHRPPMPPEIEILEPRLDANNSAEVGQSTQRIRVRVTDASEITHVTLNGRKMEPTTLQNVYVLTSLPIVAQTNFTVSAVDTHGIQNSEVFTLNYSPLDQTPPTIVILQPARDTRNIATIDTSPFSVTAQITDENGVASVKINGQQVSTSEDGTYRRSIHYASGLAGIEVSATDKAGNTDTVRFGIVYQQKPLPAPVVKPIPVEENARTVSPAEREDPRLLFTDNKLEETRRKTSNQAVFTLEFIVLDDSPIQEVVVRRSDDGTAYQVSKLGKRDYTAALQLKEGENRFEIRVADVWDNIEIETVTLTRVQTDTEAPIFTSLSVGEGIQVQQIPVRGGYLAYSTPIVVTNERPIMRGRLTDESGIDTVKVAINKHIPETVPLLDGTLFEKKLFLDYGQNHIRITATDTRGNADTTEFTLHQRPDRDGKDLALFFATDRYDGKKDNRGHWRNLTTAIADAESVAKKLRDNYGFKIKIVKNPTGRVLTETLITYQDRFIDENGAEFSYKDGSQLLIYFAGHGYYNKKTAEGYLVTRESEPPSIDESQFTALRHSNIRSNIDLIACNRVLVLMDTCFSGTFDPKYKPQTSAQLRSLVEDGTLLDQINMMLKLTARWCLTSASDEYVADTGGANGHSPFAAAFMAALDTNGGPDNLLKLDEIWQRIQESKNASIYNTLERNPQRAGLKTFERPEPRKGQFGAKEELYEESDFLLFPMGQNRSSKNEH